MAIDRTAASADNIILKEKLKFTFSSDLRKVAIVSRMFYDKSPMLFRKCPGENVAPLTKGVDYKLVFKLPGMRSADGLFTPHAGVELLTYEEDSEYYFSYRSVGASSSYDPNALRIYFEQRREVHLISFYALTLPNGSRATDVDLENPLAVLVPTVIDYSSAIGVVERDAEENRLTALITTVTEEGASDGGVSDGGMF